jgi:hypothetical protein
MHGIRVKKIMENRLGRVYRFLMGKRAGSSHLEDIRTDGRIILKQI